MPTKQTCRHLIDIDGDNWDYASKQAKTQGIKSVTNMINILLKEAQKIRESQN